MERDTKEKEACKQERNIMRLERKIVALQNELAQKIQDLKMYLNVHEVNQTCTPNPSYQPKKKEVAQ